MPSVIIHVYNISFVRIKLLLCCLFGGAKVHENDEESDVDDSAMRREITALLRPE